MINGFVSLNSLENMLKEHKISPSEIPSPKVSLCHSGFASSSSSNLMFMFFSYRKIE